MQRDAELELPPLAGEAVDARHDAAGRDRDPPRADAEAVRRRVVHPARGRERGVVVEERLADAHEDDVVRAPPEEARRARRLRGDLARREAARATVESPPLK